jgi:hypothetical protein
LLFCRRKNHVIPATAATKSTATAIPIPAFAPVLIPNWVSCADFVGLEDGLPVADVAKLVAVEDEADVEVELAIEELDVELDAFATPITASSFTPSPSLQHVVLVLPQHQLPSVHCLNGTLSDAFPPSYTDTSRLYATFALPGKLKYVLRSWYTDSRDKTGSSMLDLCTIRASRVAGYPLDCCLDTTHLACIHRSQLTDY